MQRTIRFNLDPPTTSPPLPPSWDFHLHEEENDGQILLTRRIVQRWKTWVFQFQVCRALSYHGNVVYSGSLARQWFVAARSLVQRHRRRVAIEQKSAIKRLQQERLETVESSPQYLTPLKRTNNVTTATPNSSTNTLLSFQNRSNRIPGSRLDTSVEKITTTTTPSSTVSQTPMTMTTSSWALRKSFQRLRLWRKWRRYNHRLLHSCTGHHLWKFMIQLRTCTKRRQKQRQKYQLERVECAWLMVRRTFRCWRRHVARRANAPERIFSLLLHQRESLSQTPASTTAPTATSITSRTDLDCVHLAVAGKTAFQQWRFMMFSAQVQRSMQAQGRAVHAGRLALVCLRSWQRWRTTRTLQQQRIVAAGRYFLLFRVAKKRVLRQWLALVKRRRVARTTSAAGLDAVPGLFKRLSKAYSSIGGSGVGVGVGGSGGVSYSLSSDRKGIQQRHRKKQKRISDLHQIRRVLLDWRTKAITDGSRRRIARRQMNNFREMWCSTVFHHLAQNRLWRSHFMRKWTPLFLMLRRKMLRHVMSQLAMHKRVMKVLRRESIVCVGRLKLMLSMCLWELSRRVQFRKASVVLDLAIAHMQQHRLALAFHRYKQRVAHTVFIAVLQQQTIQVMSMVRIQQSLRGFRRRIGQIVFLSVLRKHATKAYLLRMADKSFARWRYVAPRKRKARMLVIRSTKAYLSRMVERSFAYWRYIAPRKHQARLLGLRILLRDHFKAWLSTTVTVMTERYHNRLADHNAVSSLLTRVFTAWLNYTIQTIKLKHRAAKVHAKWARRVRDESFRAWYHSLVIEREINMGRAVERLRRHHLYRIALRNMYHGWRATHHRHQGLKIATMTIWHAYARKRRFRKRTTRFVDNKRDVPLILEAIQVLKHNVKSQKLASLRSRKNAEIVAHYLGKLKRTLAVGQWMRVTAMSIQVKEKICRFIRRDARRLKRGPHWLGFADETALADKDGSDVVAGGGVTVDLWRPVWRSGRVVRGYLGDQPVQIQRMLVRWDDVETSTTSSSSSTSLLSSSKAIARTVHVKTTHTTTTTTSTIEDGTTTTTATTTSMYSTPLSDLRDRQGRRLYSLSVGGLCASHYDPHPQPPLALVSDPYRYEDLIQQQEIPPHPVRSGGQEAGGGGGRDKWNPHLGLGSKMVVQENRQTVLLGLHKYSARARQRYALIQWSRAALAALYRRRRRIFLRYFGVLRGYARHLRLTREGFVARVLGFERRSTLLWVWSQFRKCSRDHIYTKLTHVLMDTLLKKRVIAWMQRLKWMRERARVALAPMSRLANYQAIRFCFLHWHVSQRYAKKMADTTLMLACLRFWRMAQAAQRMYNRSLAHRVFSSFQELLHGRETVRRGLMRVRALSGFLSCRLHRVAVNAMRRSFCKLAAASGQLGVVTMATLAAGMDSSSDMPRIAIKAYPELQTSSSSSSSAPGLPQGRPLHQLSSHPTSTVPPRPPPSSAAPFSSASLPQQSSPGSRSNTTHGPGLATGQRVTSNILAAEEILRRRKNTQRHDQHQLEAQPVFSGYDLATTATLLESAHRVLNIRSRASTGTMASSRPLSPSPGSRAGDAEEAYYDHIAFHRNQLHSHPHPHNNTGQSQSQSQLQGAYTSGVTTRRGLPPPYQQPHHQQPQPHHQLPRPSSFFGKLALPTVSHQGGTCNGGGGPYNRGGGGDDGNMATWGGDVDPLSMDLGSLSDRYTQLLKQQQQQQQQQPPPPRSTISSHQPSQQTRHLHQQRQVPPPSHRISTTSSGGFSARLSR